MLPEIKNRKHNHVESHFKSYYKLSINIPFTAMLLNWHCPKKAVIVPYSRTSHDQCHGSVSWLSYSVLVNTKIHFFLKTLYFPEYLPSSKLNSKSHHQAFPSPSVLSNVPNWVPACKQDYREREHACSALISHITAFNRIND